MRQAAQTGNGSEDGHTHLAIDGKTLKSTGEQAYGGEHPQQHLLHVYEVETGIVLEQIPIGTKTNEVGALKPFLGRGPAACSVEKGHGRLERRSLLSYLRAHWKVENHLHWRRDALLGEDRCRVRCLPVMELLAVLNTVVLSLMQVHHISTVARQLRRFASHPKEALAWLLQDF